MSTIVCDTCGELCRTVSNPSSCNNENFKALQKKIDELEGEVENRKAQVHWKCIEIDRLEGEVESLTECELKELIGKTCIQWDEYNKCQGCKNSEAVKEWRGEK